MNIFFKIISFAIKNQKLSEYTNIKLQHFIDKSRRSRQNEYVIQSMSPTDVFSKLFPKSSFDQNELVSLEIHLDDFVNTKSSEFFPTINNPYPVHFGLDREVSQLLYFLCKYTQPDIVIETGVANGFSSSYILSALDHLQHGKLYSIDDLVLPWHTKQKIGSAIPKNLKTRQTLIIGNAAQELPKLLQELPLIDIFIHDSNHTYQNMIEEFKIAWPALRKGGFLFSDDIYQHNAFLDFADTVHGQSYVIKRKNYSGFVGLIQKI
jgi:predicted O-methyltransferase YrrM